MVDAHHRRLMKTADASRLSIGIMLVIYLAACAQADGAQSSPRRAVYGLGRPASMAEIAALDIDVNPAGVGLPPGQGTSRR